MTQKIGVKFSPQLLSDLVRVGARITGNNGLAAWLTENGIPEEFKLLNSGVDRETGEFYLVFTEGGVKAPGPIEWQAPVYEKEEGHEEAAS